MRGKSNLVFNINTGQVVSIDEAVQRVDVFQKASSPDVVEWYRWFINDGFCGADSKTNRRQGYGSKDKAHLAILKYQGRQLSKEQMEAYAKAIWGE